MGLVFLCFVFLLQESDGRHVQDSGGRQPTATRSLPPTAQGAVHKVNEVTGIFDLIHKYMCAFAELSEHLSVTLRKVFV